MTQTIESIEGGGGGGGQVYSQALGHCHCQCPECLSMRWQDPVVPHDFLPSSCHPPQQEEAVLMVAPVHQPQQEHQIRSQGLLWLEL